MYSLRLFWFLYLYSTLTWWTVLMIEYLAHPYYERNHRFCQSRLYIIAMNRPSRSRHPHTRPAGADCRAGRYWPNHAPRNYHLTATSPTSSPQYFHLSSSQCHNWTMWGHALTRDLRQNGESRLLTVAMWERKKEFIGHKIRHGHKHRKKSCRVVRTVSLHVVCRSKLND